jgi:sugar/nucleoside kinase (ribokinase family)
MRQGILVSGNWIIDQVKVIDSYPDEEKLVNILNEYSSNGGSAYNILKDLAKLKVDFPLSGLGLVGDDERGNKIIAECKTLLIDTLQLRKTSLAHTSYTDVMTVQGTGKRTFFHQRGANDLLSINDFNLSISNAKIFHLGYLLLLKEMDFMDVDGQTGASRVLKSAKEQGFITSADIVSEHSDRFKTIIPPSLPFIDYLFVNEYEAGKIAGIETTTNGQVIIEKCLEAASRMIEMGVREWVVLHYPDGAIAMNKNGEELFQPSIQLPLDKILGSVGAGDAFAAGVLNGVHEGWGMEKSLKLGVCSAATSLFEATSSDGILPTKECLLLANSYGYKTITQFSAKIN